MKTVLTIVASVAATLALVALTGLGPEDNSPTVSNYTTGASVPTGSSDYLQHPAPVIVSKRTTVVLPKRALSEVEVQSRNLGKPLPGVEYYDEVYMRRLQLGRPVPGAYAYDLGR